MAATAPTGSAGSTAGTPSFGGSWHPLPCILYASAIYPFSPVMVESPSLDVKGKAKAVSWRPGHGVEAADGKGEGGRGAKKPELVTGNAHQVPLEVGDDCYLFEQYIPPAHGEDQPGGVWYRGYVFSGSSGSSAATSTVDAGTNDFGSGSGAVKGEPTAHVFIGIFPAAYIQVRERLDDVAVPDPTPGPGAADGVGQIVRRMDPLVEEDEDVASNPASTPRAQFFPPAAGIAHARRQSRGSSLIGSDSVLASLSTSPTSSGPIREDEEEDLRDPPPLPALRAGDDTLVGATEPLVDETASALRAYASLLYTHLMNRDYHRFRLVSGHIEALHQSRKRLLLNAAGKAGGAGLGLSKEEEIRLRREMVKRLAAANAVQDLEVIVRHPDFGALVDPRVGPATEGITPRDKEDTADLGPDPRGWMSIIRMYTHQVNLAYQSASRPANVLAPLSAGMASSAAQAKSKLAKPNRVPINAHLYPSSQTPQLASSLDSSDRPAAGFFHVLVDAKSLNPSSVSLPSGESLELYFSLYDKSESRFLTEEWCVVIGEGGRHVPSAGKGKGRPGLGRTVFTDLSAHDVLDEMYLVCRIVRNGALRPPPLSQSSLSASTPASSTPPAGATSHGQMTHRRPDDTRSFRRPFACAALQLPSTSFASPEALDSIASSDGFVSQTMTLFAPASSVPGSMGSASGGSYAEAAFPTLHEDIIHSRAKEIVRLGGASFPAGSIAASSGQGWGLDGVAVGIKVMFGDLKGAFREGGAAWRDVAVTNRLGFPDVVFPDDTRNEVFLKLWAGDFASLGSSGGGAGGAGASVEVGVEVRAGNGKVVKEVISRGSGRSKVSRYESMVYRGTTQPTWGELLRLDVPPTSVQDCHIFFTFRNRAERPLGRSVSPNAMDDADRPFAFAYLPLLVPAGPSDSADAFVPDGVHHLVVFRYDPNSATPAVYLGSEGSETTPSLSPLKDSFTVRTFLCSTFHTQDDNLLRLMRWDKVSADSSSDGLADVLAKLRFAPEVEVCKFIRPVFDALFAILASPVNAAGGGRYDDAIFSALVTLLGIVADRRFTNFKPVVDAYVERHFASPTAHAPMMRSLQKLLADPAAGENAQQLRASIKVWEYLLRFIVRSRDVQRLQEVERSGAPADVDEAKFKADVSLLISRITHLMTLSTPTSIIGTQTLAVQHFASLLPDLGKCYAPEELLDIVDGFCDAISATKGKIVVWKLVLQEHIIMSALFDTPSCRAQLIPKLVGWVKPHLGRPDELSASTKTKGSDALRDGARVAWLEGARISVAIVAAALDRLHEALVDPDVVGLQDALAQEQDNVDYLLSLLPRLLESFKAFEDPANLDVVERSRTTATVVPPVPAVFPASYPFSLLSRQPDDAVTDEPTLQAARGEIGCVVAALLLLAPTRLLKGFFDGMLEVEGEANFVRFLRHLFQVCLVILDDGAFSSRWLNINVVAHCAIVKLAEIASEVLLKSFVPSREARAEAAFNAGLWTDFLTMLHRLLASPHLAIEDFSPQKRRAVWRLAGDIRGRGARVLKTTWDALADGFQTHFVPSMVESLLELCLSHHDELRSNAVSILHAVILAEYALHQDFTVIGDEILDKLDQLIGNSTSRADEISRAFFITQLRQLFDASPMDDRLRAHVAAFMGSVTHFLELLLGIRSLPPGDEFIDDRVIGTLKLMSFIRDIGRSAIYIRYVHKLVNFHASSGNFTEAGLAMKLHADLHEWNPSQTIEEMPDLDLPSQTEFARKETLYVRILDYLGKGQAWESAIEICKELQTQYEHVSFDYSKLAEILAHQADLYNKIIKTDRFFSHYFRVAFYGKGFPATVQSRQFVYRGHQLEKYGAFCERMQNKHPRAQILKTATVPLEKLERAEGQFVHVLGVVPEPDRGSVVFTNADVPTAVRTYYENNATNTFSFSRPFVKGGDATATPDPALSWIEKTFLVCEDAFPTVLQRSEVVELRLLELSPVENAIVTVEAKTRELESLLRRYVSLSQDRTAKVNTNPLSMTLNGTVDAPANGGVPTYRKHFFSDAFLRENPDKEQLVTQLRKVIDKQALVIDDCLRLHGRLCPPEMRSFHLTLERFFEKNFADEIGRLEMRSSGGEGTGTETAYSSPRPSTSEVVVASAVPVPMPAKLFPITNGGARLSVAHPRREPPPTSGSGGMGGSRGRADSAATARSESTVANPPLSTPSTPLATTKRSSQAGGIDAAPAAMTTTTNGSPGQPPLSPTRLGRRGSVPATTAAFSAEFGGAGAGPTSPTKLGRSLNGIVEEDDPVPFAGPGVVPAAGGGGRGGGVGTRPGMGAGGAEGAEGGKDRSSTSVDTLKSSRNGDRRSFLGSVRWPKRK